MATLQGPSGDKMEITTSDDIDLASQPRLDSSIWANKINKNQITPTSGREVLSMISSPCATLVSK